MASLRVFRLAGPVLALALDWGHSASPAAMPWAGGVRSAGRLVTAVAATGSAATVEVGLEIDRVNG
jgi:hypothetical protein